MHAFVEIQEAGRAVDDVLGRRVEREDSPSASAALLGGMRLVLKNGPLGDEELLRGRVISGAMSDKPVIHGLAIAG